MYPASPVAAVSFGDFGTAIQLLLALIAGAVPRGRVGGAAVPLPATPPPPPWSSARGALAPPPTPPPPAPPPKGFTALASPTSVHPLERHASPNPTAYDLQREYGRLSPSQLPRLPGLSACGPAAAAGEALIAAHERRVHRPTGSHRLL